MSDFSDMAVIVMAWRRPYYLQETLESYARARGIQQVRRFIVGLGPHERMPQNLEVIEQAEKLMGRDIEVKMDSPRAMASPAMHRPMGEAANFAWADPEVGWVILSEDDDPVSDDVLEYMTFCRDSFEEDQRVLLACAHNFPSLPGFVGPAPADKEDKPLDEADEDQSIVRLKQGFDSHTWGTWRDRWEEVLEPTWDWECNSGGPTTSGIDWQIATRVMPRGGYVAAFPDASRAVNIGRLEGVYMVAEDKPEGWRSSQSFREHREPPVEYRFVG